MNVTPYTLLILLKMSSEIFLKFLLDALSYSHLACEINVVSLASSKLSRSKQCSTHAKLPMALTNKCCSLLRGINWVAGFICLIIVVNLPWLWHLYVIESHLLAYGIWPPCNEPPRANGDALILLILCVGGQVLYECHWSCHGQEEYVTLKS